MSTRVLLRAGQRLSMEHLEDRINPSAVAFTSQMSPLTANGVSFDKADVKKADLNGDGDDDFVVSFANARLFVYEKTGPNSFSNRQLIAPSLRRFPLQGQSQLEFDLIDLNSDGLKDIVVLGKKTTVYFSEPSAGPPLVGKEFGFQVALLDDVYDFNQDGAPDLVELDGNVTRVLLNDVAANQRFQVVPSSEHARIPQVMDVDFDLDLDLVFTNEVLLNNGKGVFSTPQALSVPQPETFWFDFEGDGDTDVLVHRDQNLEWYVNRDGTVESTAPFLMNRQVADDWQFVDLDGDHDLDLLEVVDGKLKWRPNQGDDFFGGRVLYAAQQIIDVGLFDSDEDGDNDVFVESIRAGQIQYHWLQNLSNRQFVATEIRFFPREEFSTDVDEDGDLDFIHLGRWYDSVADLESTRLFDVIPPRLLGAIDIDGDRQKDVYANLNNNIVWYRNLGPWEFSEPRVIAPGLGELDMQPGDIDRDGDIDFLVVVDRSLMLVYEQTDMHHFEEHAISFNTTTSSPRVLVDADNDGDLDVISGRNLLFAENLGGFQFGEATELIEEGIRLRTFQVINDPAENRVRVAGFQRRELIVFEFSSTPNLTVQEVQRTAVDRSFAESQVVDIDLDGDTDLIGWNEGTVFLFKQTDGEFTNDPIMISRDDPDEITRAWDIEAADVDADGDLDLLIPSSAGKYAIAWFENVDGRGTFSGIRQLMPDESLTEFLPRTVSSIDVDRDGQVELLVGTVMGVDIMTRSDSLGLLVGDNNYDGTLSVADIDLHCRPETNTPYEMTNPRIFDYNPTFQRVDQHDLDILVNTIVKAVPGDVDQSGSFDSSDLVRLWQQGKYEDEIPGNSLWSEGDWNCDGDFDSQDLTYLFKNGTYRHQSRAEGNWSAIAARMLGQIKPFVNALASVSRR